MPRRMTSRPWPSTIRASLARRNPAARAPATVVVQTASATRARCATTSSSSSTCTSSSPREPRGRTAAHYPSNPAGIPRWGIRARRCGTVARVRARRVIVPRGGTHRASQNVHQAGVTRGPRPRLRRAASRPTQADRVRRHPNRMQHVRGHPLADAGFQGRRGKDLGDSRHVRVPEAVSPSLHADASGQRDTWRPVERATYDEIKSEFLKRLRELLPLDGLYLPDARRDVRRRAAGRRGRLDDGGA